MRFTIVQIIAAAALTAAAIGATGSASAATVTPLLQVDLDDLDKREALMLTVEYPAGDASASHRHNAHTFVYVLEGAVVMQVAGGEPTVVAAGETFYETPQDIHVVSKNASTTAPAKILVFFIKPQNAPATVAVP